MRIPINGPRFHKREGNKALTVVETTISVQRGVFRMTRKKL